MCCCHATLQWRSSPRGGSQAWTGWELWWRLHFCSLSQVCSLVSQSVSSSISMSRRLCSIAPSTVGPRLARACVCICSAASVSRAEVSRKVELFLEGMLVCGSANTVATALRLQTCVCLACGVQCLLHYTNAERPGGPVHVSDLADFACPFRPASGRTPESS